MIPRRGIANGVLQAPFNVKSLFAKGEQGVWYDPSDLSTLFQDSAGTTPVTAVGQPVGKMLDKSGRGNHATQTTAASRPVLSARVNLLTKTEDFGDATWSKINSSISGSVGTLQLITRTSTVAPAYIRQTIGGSIPVGTTLTATVTVKKGTVGNLAAIRLQSTYPSRLDTIVDLDTGIITFNTGNGYTDSSASSTANADGSYTVFIKTTVGGSALTAILTGSASAPTSGWEGASATMLNAYVSKVHVEASPVFSNYQYVNTSTDYNAAGFPMYLSCDGVDDGMVTPSIDFTPTDKMTVWAGVRKLSDAAIAILVEMSSNSTSNVGTFLISAPNAVSASRYGLGLSGSSLGSFTDYGTYLAPLSNVITASFDIRAGNKTTQQDARINSIVPSSKVLSGASSAGTGNFGNFPLYLFRRAGLSLPLNGNFYGLVIRGAASSPKQISQVEKYLALKTGVSL